MKKLLSIITIAIAASALLSGCATHFTSKVSIKQSWPTELADRSFAIEENEVYGETEEFIQASDLINKRLQELGFNTVKENETSALKVEIQLNSQLRNQFFSPFYPTSFGMTPYGNLIRFDPFYSYAYRSSFHPRILISSRFRSSMYSPFYMQRSIHPFYIENLMDREIFQHSVGITIKDVSGKTLYMVSASSEHFGYEIYSHIPFLVQSALQDFPGKDGKYILEIPLK
jgi:hypothetical protein